VLEKREPPRAGFRVVRERSISGRVSTLAQSGKVCWYTVKRALNGVLNLRSEDLSLAPDLDDAAYLVLYVGVGSLVGGRGALGDNGVIGFKEFVLFADLGLLDNLYGASAVQHRRTELGPTIREIYERQLLAGGGFLDALEPELSDLIGMASVA